MQFFPIANVLVFFFIICITNCYRISEFKQHKCINVSPYTSVYQKFNTPRLTKIKVLCGLHFFLEALGRNPFLIFLACINNWQGLPGGSDGKESTCNVGDLGLIPGSGRSSGEGHGNSLHNSWLENSMNRGAWWAKVHAVTKSQTLLSD